MAGARINHRFANVDRGMHYPYGWSRVRGAAGLNSAAAEIEDGRADAIVYIDEISGDDVFRVTTDGADITWTEGSTGAPIDKEIVIASTGVSYSISDEDGGLYVRINPSAATGRWLRFGPGADANEAITYYFEGDRAAVVLPRVTSADRVLITTVEDGMIVYDTDLDAFYGYVAGVWAAIGGVSDHGALTGLGDDDHTIYMLLAGRAGGQVLIGGTGSGDDITFESTSHGTKGTVFFRDSAIVINNNAAAATAELPNVTMMGGDGVAAPNDDVVSTVVTQDSINEYVSLNVLRARNGGGATAIDTVFQLGVGNTSGRLRAGDGSGADDVGAPLTIQGGRSTGDALGGAIDFEVTPFAGSGSGLNTLARALRLDAPDLGGGVSLPAAFFGEWPSDNPPPARCLYEMTSDVPGTGGDTFRLTAYGNAFMAVYSAALNVGDVRAWSFGCDWEANDLGNAGDFAFAPSLGDAGSGLQNRLRIGRLTGWTHIDSNASTVVERCETMNVGYAQTNDNATWTTIFTVEVPADHQLTGTAMINAGEASGTGAGGSYQIRFGARNNGTLADIGISPNILAFENDASWDVRSNISGTSYEIQVLGDATNVVNWKAMVTFSIIDMTVTH